MPSIADSTIAIDTPISQRVKDPSPIMVGASGASDPPLRGVLPSSQVLAPVTVKGVSAAGNSTLQLAWQSTEPISAKPVSKSSVVPITPKSPSIVAGSFSSSAVGYSFLVKVERDSTDGVVGYNIYRGTGSSFTGAVRIQYIPQPVNNFGSLQVSDPMPQKTSTSYSYWVTSVNSNGLESAPVGVGAAGLIGVPQEVTNISATESPYKTSDGQMLSLVAVDFTPAANDPYFTSVNIYFTGYNGNSEAQLMANAATSPAQFLCETTHETVTVTVVAVGPSQVEASFANAPTTTLTLDGVVSAPPSPSISQAQVALAGNKGWQFAFNIIGGLEADQIQCYRIYHSESSSEPAAGSGYYRTIPQPNTNIGQEIVQEVTDDILYYWVSAVNTSGLESSLVAVPFTYIDPGSPPPNVNPVSVTNTYQPETNLNGWGANAHDGNYEGSGGLGSEVWGLNSAVTLAYTGPSNAFDGNQSTSAYCSEAHTHQYAGCIWDFSNFKALPSGNTTTAAQISVVSSVSPTSGPVAGHADIWYTLDGGTTWKSLYVSYSARSKQTDTITLATTQDFTKIQVMAFLDSHDDIRQDVFDISLSVTQTTNPGPQQVTGVVASLNNGNVEITWNGEVPLSRTDILNYQVYRASHGAGYVNSHLQTTITPAPPQATYSWTDPEAHDGSWDYWVIAENSTGYSPSSDVATLFSAGSTLYSNGMTVDSLKPNEAGADNTANHGNVLIQNPNFQAGNVGWTTGSGFVGSIVSGSGYNGSPYVASFSDGTGVLINNQKIPCAAGAVISATAYFNAAAGVAGTANVRITYYNSSGTSLSYQDFGNLSATGSVWQQARGTLVAPASTAYAQVLLIIYSAGATWYAGGCTASILANTLDEVPNGSSNFSVAAIDPNRFALIDFSQSGHRYKTASNIVYANGSTIEDLRPAQSGADVTSQNGNVLLQNPNFVAGNVGWSLGTGWSITTISSLAISPPAPSFTECGLFSVGSTVTTSAITNAQTIPCAPGAVVSAACFVFGSNTAGGSACIRINYYNSSGNVLQTTNGNFAPSNAGWNQSRCVVSAPANTAYATIDFAVYGGTNIWAITGFSASILANSLDEVPDGTTHLRVPATVYGPSGNAIDTSGNLKLKNTSGHDPGGPFTVSKGSSLTFGGSGSSTDVPNMGSTSSALNVALKGNPVLVALSASFSCVSSGGTVTACPQLTYTSSTAPSNPNAVISGDGNGATVGVTVTQQGSPPTSYTVTVNATPSNGGSGYSTAAVNLYVNGVSVAQGGCTVSASSPVSGQAVSVQALLNGTPIVGPFTGATDALGRLNLHGTELLVAEAGTEYPGAGQGQFEVQAVTTSGTAVTGTNCKLAVVELG